jgi:hypothetical protein
MFDTSLNKAWTTDRSTQFGFWLTHVHLPSWLTYANQLESIPSSALARTILHSNTSSAAQKYRWVLIDAEHGLITDKDYYEVRFKLKDLSDGYSILRVNSYYFADSGYIRSYAIPLDPKAPAPLFACRGLKNG